MAWRGEMGRGGAGKSFFRVEAGWGSKREIQVLASRGCEMFFLVGARRPVKNSPRFGLWKRYEEYHYIGLEEISRLPYVGLEEI